MPASVRTTSSSSAVSRVGTRRDLDVDRARRADAAVASTFPTRRGDAAAGRAARDARRGGDDLPEDGAPHLAHFARAAAHVAPRRVRPGLAARALTTLAR